MTVVGLNDLFRVVQTHPKSILLLKLIDDILPQNDTAVLRVYGSRVWQLLSFSEREIQSQGSVSQGMTQRTRDTFLPYHVGWRRGTPFYLQANDGRFVHLSVGGSWSLTASLASATGFATRWGAAQCPNAPSGSRVVVETSSFRYGPPVIP